jgi:lipopolysaccharide transport system permease protein
VIVPALAGADRRRRLVHLRDLVWELVGREIKVRYTRSVLGVAWALVTPLAQLLVFSFLFRQVLPAGVPNYAAFTFCGVLVWGWFQSSVLFSAAAIVDNRDLIRRPGFPAAILPLVTVGTNFVHFVVALPVLLLVLLVSGLPVTPAVLALPLVVALQFVLTLGLAYVVAAVHVTFRDTQHVLGVGLMLLFYLTPVFYDAAAVPQRYRPLYDLNPLVHLVGAYRAILLGGGPPAPAPLLGLAVLGAAGLRLGLVVFARASDRFAEEV